ncbi:MAG: hypothetical protein UR29_C0001G0120 [Candidatus Woesebacteria bacterium GW2011_GWC2_33_12]|uniref:Uncharacterized protein n=1 Tax=Candidatus Woesebacteria bacterium GW2011_GWB1_33_22 TaxID=1618566 RepID=A0A0G0C2Y0_9BACT|nr:MAG: hypothetical protein UR29_C0001G0120 [Candidatus Woesebacteria bacterium GW2011_GWC2_33_12]KKP42670.1 MAG: hypothetical protein UR33_C0001G0031 [Candidatus Woesebacteria bacterium GW2011_GWA2_33_20]KKP45555.1 MAG: hypothetical protein UR35_C0001G0152 [Candidatus Woesebacteria bacterium GW2011_GWB1_33_22]KKP47427.1 MAG: hypothetical protein UR37_C0001G0120 [Microgenomates group bacterium GW2011_GWC1_33_28]KKP51173.1 MAG: hypothetical protein UR41_C0001G0120 [Candidatus Woesebacteria bact
MQENKLDLTDKIMSKIKTGQIKMKPRWYFTLGSLALIFGLASSYIVTIFSIRIFMFSIKAHGPMATVRFQQIISDFPIWAPIVAIIGIVVGIIMLKKYDFSYKKNFYLIIIGFIISIILSIFIIDYFSMDSFMYGRTCGRTWDRTKDLTNVNRTL